MQHAPPASSPRELTAALDVVQIHDDYADFVWRTLQRLGVPTQDLEDNLQEVFVVVHRRLSTFDGSAKVSTWLFGICLRVAAAYRRRAHLRREHSSHDLDERPDPSARADPERIAMGRQAEQRLEQALAALSLERRAVFVLFEIEGMPTAAIAEMLGIPVGTVYSRLSAARTEFSQAVLRLSRRDTSGGIR